MIVGKFRLFITLETFELMMTKAETGQVENYFPLPNSHICEIHSHVYVH